jgi:soluble lytic murein transglycosylase-like protein
MWHELKYIAALARSLFTAPDADGARTRRPIRPLLLVALLLTVAAWSATGQATAAASPEPRSFTDLLQRVETVGRHLERTEAFYEEQIAPLERVLRSQGAEEPLARRVAAALVAEARRSNIEPRLLLGVLLVENPWINPTARSPVGARGLMQVMPFHEGKWGDCEPRLDNIEANICHGARIFAHYLETEKGNLERALLRYNGCVRGTNTPDCHTYPNHVLARTARASLHDWRRSVASASAP